MSISPPIILWSVLQEVLAFLKNIEGKITGTEILVVPIAPRVAAK